METNVCKREMDSSSDESENEFKIQMLPKRPSETTKKQSKSGALWKEILEEEGLMENMKTFEVAKNNRKRKIDRGAESYDYSKDSDLDEKRPKPEIDDIKPNISDQKKFKLNHNLRKIDKIPKNLEDLTITDVDEELFAKELAHKLEEENLTLMKKVITAIGKEECKHYYEKTQKIESKGGLLTFNKQRRRTSGGIFLFLIKTSNKVTNEQKKLIFEKDPEG